MPIYCQHIDSSYRWGIWKTDETPEELLAMLPRSDHYRQEAQRFKSGSRRLEWLSVRVLLYTLLGEEKNIDYHADGAPFLSDATAAISISHTRGYVAVLLASPDKSIGIDIECYGERVQKVAHKFMRPDETAEPFRGTDTWSLLLHWSAKETLFKCLRSDEVDFREHLHILPFPIAAQGSFTAAQYRTAAKRQYLIHYCLFPDFVLTYCL